MKAIFFLALAPLLAMWYGFALLVMWAWFVVPVFHVAPLRLPYAIGIAYIVQFLTHQTLKDDPETAHLLTMAIAKPLILLFVGWIVTWFI